MAEMPLRNTVMEDIVAFDLERKQFDDHAKKFKFGFVENGIVAVSCLRNMYLELLYTRHSEKNKTEADGLLLRLDDLEEKIYSLSNMDSLMVQKSSPKRLSTLKNQTFLSIGRDMYGIAFELKKIKKECGYG